MVLTKDSGENEKRTGPACGRAGKNIYGYRRRSYSSLAKSGLGAAAKVAEGVDFTREYLSRATPFFESFTSNCFPTIASAAARVLVPRFLRTFFGPLVETMARLGLAALTPISRFLSFIIGLDLLKWLFFLFGHTELVEPLMPVLDSVGSLVQGFFSTPRGISVASGF